MAGKSRTWTRGPQTLENKKLKHQKTQRPLSKNAVSSNFITQNH